MRIASNIAGALFASGLLGLAAVQPAHADMVFSLPETPAGVTITARGSFNLSGTIVVGGTTAPTGLYAGGSPFVGVGNGSGQIQYGADVTNAAPAPWGSIFNYYVASAFPNFVGDSIFFVGDQSFIAFNVPIGYVSGSFLSGSDLVAGHSFGSFGLVAGSLFVYEYGIGVDADRVTVQVGPLPVAVPEPAAALLFAGGLLGLLAGRRRAACAGAAGGPAR